MQVSKFKEVSSKIGYYRVEETEWYERIIWYEKLNNANFSSDRMMLNDHCVFHRENNPALFRIVKNRCVEVAWFQHGLCHREDGPAIAERGQEYGDWSYDWYINHENITSYVERWARKKNISAWPNWSSGDKILFKMSFI